MYSGGKSERIVEIKNKSQLFQEWEDNRKRWGSSKIEGVIIKEKDVIWFGFEKFAHFYWGINL